MQMFDTADLIDAISVLADQAYGSTLTSDRLPEISLGWNPIAAQQIIEPANRRWPLLRADQREGPLSDRLLAPKLSAV